MVKIYDEYEGMCEGPSFSSYRKNLGNKLFIYAACKIIADLLDYDLEVPPNPLIQRRGVAAKFPFGSITGRTRIEEPYTWIHDGHVATYGSLAALAELSKDQMFYTNASFTAYPLLKPYEKEVRELYSSLVGEPRTGNDILIMLRESNHDRTFRLPYSFQFDILEKETYDTIYISSDHPENHSRFTNTLKQRGHNIVLLDDLGILELFKEITTFKKIIATQGSFSFWAAWLSHAETIYWPITNDGPNSYHLRPRGYYDVNFVVEDDPRYKFINVENIHEPWKHTY